MKILASPWSTLPLVGLLSLAAAAGCGEVPEDETSTDVAAVALSGGGVTVDVVTTTVWSTGFNGAVRLTNTAFPSPITAFEIVFRLGGSATVAGSAWNGNISAADGAGNRTSTNPDWLPFNAIQTGQTW